MSWILSSDTMFKSSSKFNIVLTCSTRYKPRLYIETLVINIWKHRYYNYKTEMQILNNDQILRVFVEVCPIDIHAKLC